MKRIIVAIFLVGLTLSAQISYALDDAKMLQYDVNKKDAALAPVSSFILPTLGHYYAGDWGRGFEFVGLELGCLGSLGISAMAGTPSLGYSMFSFGMQCGVSGFIGLPAIRIMEMYDSYFTAEEKNSILRAHLGLSKDSESSLIQYYSEDKNPRIAAGYAFVFPSLGHWYAGDWGRGMNFLVPEAVLIALPGLWTDYTSWYVCLIGMAVTRVWEVADAASTAEDCNTKLRKKYGIIDEQNNPPKVENTLY